MLRIFPPPRAVPACVWGPSLAEAPGKWFNMLKCRPNPARLASLCWAETSGEWPHSAHTSNPVPLVYAGGSFLTLADHGALCDIAPRLLAMMGRDKAPEMSGQPLLRPLAGVESTA